MDKIPRVFYNQYMETNKNRIITIILIGLNAAVFLGVSLLGNTQDGMFLLRFGAMYGPYVLEKGEYFRLFTAMFLHFDFYHLMNNMVMLGAFGMYLEPEFGSFRLLIAYLISGIGGNILSLVMHMGRGEAVVSAGASGAVFGLMGVMVWLVIRNRGSFGRIYGRRILLMVVLSLYFGFSSSGVDNYAHVGGLICGFLAAVLLYRKKSRTFKTGA